MSANEKLTGENLTTEVFETEDGALFLTEAEAIIEFPAIPLYFPTSYSLVKPYIRVLSDGASSVFISKP